MNKKQWVVLVPLMAFASVVVAGGGHDHGTEKITTHSATPAAPRLVMESAQFELVGTLQQNRLSLYLDDYASNVPVTQAQIELEIAGQRITAKANADGSYDAALLQPLPDGKYPVMATLLTDQAADLLTGEFSVHLAHDQGAHAATVAPTADHGGHFLPWLVAGLAVALFVVLITLRQDSFSRRKIP